MTLGSTGHILSLALTLTIAASGASRAQNPKVPRPPDGAAAKVQSELKQVQAALNASDLKTALTHAEAAASEAERSFSPKDRLRIDAAITVHDVRAAKAIFSGDLATAIAEYDSAVRLGQTLGASDPLRLRVLMVSAELLMKAKRSDGALARYEEAATGLAKGKPGTDVSSNVLCGVMAGYLRAESAGANDPTAVRLLDDVRRVLSGPSAKADEALRPVAIRIWSFLLGRSMETPATVQGATEAAGAKLASDLDLATTVLARAGGSPALTDWGKLYLVRFQHDRGRFGEAETTLAGLAKRAEANAPPDFRAEYLSYSGSVATRRGDYSAAREAHEAEKNLRRDRKLFGTHRTLNSLGRVLLRMGDFQGAQTVLEEAAGLCASDPSLKFDPIRPIILTQLGRAIEGTGDLNQAARLHREAIALAEKAPRPEPSTIAMCRNNLGVNRYAAGDLASAGREFEAARAIAAKAFGEVSLSVAEVDVNLGWVARTGGNPEKAESLFRSALKTIDADSPDSRRKAEVLGYLASVEGQLGRADEAGKTIVEAVSLRESLLRRALKSSFSDRERLAIVQELRFHPESRAWPGVLDTYLMLAPSAKIEPEEEYARVLVWKGAVGRGAISGIDATDPAVKTLLAERVKALNALRVEAAEVPSPSDREAHAKRLASLEAIADDLERRLRSNGKPDAASQDARPQSVLASVPTGWALVDVIEVRRPSVLVQKNKPLREDRQYLAFVIREGKPIARIDLGDADPIDGSIREFLRVMDATTDAYVAPANMLATLVRDPLRAHLDGVKGIVLAGDGLFHRLPLAALPGSKPGTFWVEEMTFANVPSAQSLIARRASRARHPGALVVGDVEYGGLPGFDPLPKTKDEAEDVAGSFQKAHASEPLDRITRSGASEPAIRGLLASRGLVHLATHGFFPDQMKAQGSAEVFGTLAGSDSGIVLAKAKPSAKGAAIDPSDDQKLTADEIGHMDLRGVDLMVLSACSSGLGHISAGQGVIGLVGALDRAGVRAVACSLWKVDDSATAALMKSFYKHLWNDGEMVGPASALRSAQIDLIRGGSKMFAHPRFWASFVLSGDPEGK